MHIRSTHEHTLLALATSAWVERVVRNMVFGGGYSCNLVTGLAVDCVFILAAF